MVNKLKACQTITVEGGAWALYLNDLSYNSFKMATLTQCKLTATWVLVDKTDECWHCMFGFYLSGISMGFPRCTSQVFLCLSSLPNQRLLSTAEHRNLTIKESLLLHSVFGCRLLRVWCESGLLHTHSRTCSHTHKKYGTMIQYSKVKETWQSQAKKSKTKNNTHTHTKERDKTTVLGFIGKL